MSRGQDHDFYYDEQRSPTTAGSWIAEAATALMTWITSAVIGVAMLIVPAACIVLDLMLGPQFIDSWTETNGTPLSGLATSVPMVISVAMTGLQYALFDRIQVAMDQPTLTAKAKVMMAIAGTIAVADTIIDVGGVTSWRYADAEAANIIPSDPDAAWAFQALSLGLLCLLHEPIMQSLLARFKGHYADKAFRGSSLIKGGVRAGGWVLNIVKSGALLAGGVSMFVLDLILVPQLGTSTGITITMWFASFALTGIQLMLWQRHENVGLKRAKRGADKLDRFYVGAAWSVAVIDTLADVAGFTTAVYGSGTEIVVIPDRPTWVWGLGVVIVATVCFAGERLFREMLWRPRKDADDGASDWSKPKSGSDAWGWGADWDSGWDANDDGAKDKKKGDDTSSDDGWL